MSTSSAAEPVRPRVLVPWPNDVGTTVGRLVVALAVEVERALTRAGAEVVRLGADSSAEAASAALAGSQALVLVGGGDVDPRLYGGVDDHPSVDHVDAERDGTEVALVRESLDADLPVLALCRGAQVVNVALGGTLRPQVDNDHVVHHGSSTDALFVQHDVDVRAGTRLAATLGAGPRPVWSGHHQAIERLAADLVATATTADGVVEAVEHAERDLVAVQWHPEYGEPGPPDEPDLLFGDLVARARARAASATT